MMSLMLIDDDVPMLEYVEYLLGSLGLELTLVASASGSEDALQQFHALLPDIVIIDIGLPGMDGLELADAFRIMKPEVRLIFLTCYEDFHYSKRAIQLEADDYLIKDELSPEQLKGSLNKAISRLRSREELLERYSFRQAIERNKEVLKLSFLKQLLSGAAEQESTLEFGQRLGISLRLPYLRQGMLHMDAASLAERYGYRDIPLIHFAVSNIALELSAGQAEITPFMTGDAGIYVIWNVADPSQPQDVLIKWMRAVQSKVEQYLKITLYGFYSEAAATLRQFGTLHKTFAEARDVNFYKPPAAVAVIDEPAEFAAGGEWRGDKERGMLSLALEDGNAAWIDLAVGQWVQQVSQERLQPRLAKEICGNFVRQLAFEAGGLAEEAFFTRLEQCVHVDEAARLTKRELRNLWRQHTFAPAGAAEKDVRLQAVDRFLEENAGQMVTSNDMAEYLHLNASYFSRYFKKLSGSNFTDYVNQYKMNLAISMLARPHETVENVAYTLGFSDRAYFSKVFKKYSGKNPSEFKAQPGDEGLAGVQEEL
ncbi:helix-turn-helix domain-containing protein [Paenibacillus sp. MMS20-IR301]|uniref:response regulator transcription factor n=1 Tax=Paenibacillus sp. MMS20-IR301 TaxID=2895946 RepID=UPI0028E7865C|nr:helix-turn-helix domain-containing protein [Paenibacillus sp. MMS20-IR301]WNS46194.1 helix-turn-helix domain-containing protein [Paenibacillus sp. MMS20-IR301]